jgi:Mrp family chromosome partitioning ATPase
MLAARLRYSTSIERGVIVVTGARPEDGKSTVAAHIAAELAAAGNSVIAVEADLHRPALHRLLDVPPEQVGITDVGTAESSLTRALVNVVTGRPKIAVQPPRPVSAVPSRRGKNSPPDVAEDEISADFEVETLPESEGELRLLPAGTRRGHEAGSALTLGNASAIVMHLRSLCDYIVVDTPPLLLSGDAYPLLQLADTVVVVVRRGSTRQHEAGRAKEVLHSLGVREYSVVLTEADAAERDYYGYESR